MIERPSARLILLDPQDRLFLFNVHDPAVFDPTDPHHDPFWVMIGGMVDPGEEFVEAAVREAYEETKLPVIDAPRWVWQRQRRMSWRGKDVLHKERFFLARTDRTEIDTSGLDERERSWTRGHRWWKADEIAASGDRFEPGELGSHFAALLRDGVPAEPITLSS
ncbi:MAG: NUDIX domain-containing protein [Alphaproteobacteria bacterium]|nr:NUDIX domain-containing protein [Alphaproteobacteria bacterium]MBV8407311.1 NUDIX domain-containing protein [Alphaproteobacteria bacterium]